MSEKVIITESTLDNIGDAIREKNGESDKYYPNQMPAAIRRIPSGGGGGGSVVAVFPVLLSGEHIADIVVDGDRFALYAPEPITYTPGTGIEIDENNAVSVSAALRATISGKAEQTALDTAVTSLTASLASKQGLLIPGDGITITNNVISADGTDVEANPTGTPTDQLDTIRIGTDIYEIVGGGGGSGYSETDLWTGTGNMFTSLSLTMDDDYSNYDAIKFEYQSVRGDAQNVPVHYEKLISKETIETTDRFSISDFYLWNNVGVNVSGTFTDGTHLTTYLEAYSWFSSCTLTKIVGVKYGGGGGGASAVSDLTDVSLSNLANGQILKYNSTTQKWENANESGGGSTLPFDIVINSNDNGIDLVYDDGT